MINALLQKFFPTTIDRTTSASNPGNLQINYWKYFRSFPEETYRQFADLLIWLISFLLITGFYWIFGRWSVDQIAEAYSTNYSGTTILLLLYIFFGLCLNAAFFRVLPKIMRSLGWWLNHLREHFIFGSVNPAIVVSQSPPLVAVSTDLRKWDQSYPAVKILEQPLNCILGEIPPVGTQLAAVSLYYVGEDYLPYWADFKPIVVNCVTDSQADVDRLLHSLRPEDWQNLQDGLSCVEKRNQPGLYFVNTSEHYVLPEGAEHEEDFAAIEELEFFDVQDVLRVDYQVGNVLRLHRGFPSAQVDREYARTAKFRQPSASSNDVAGTVGILVVVMGTLQLSNRIFDLFPHIANSPLLFLLFLLLISVVAIPIAIIYQFIYFVTKPFAQAWEFDQNLGTLTVTSRRIFPRDRSVVYPLSQFHNIAILRETKDEVVEYSLVLKRVPHRGLLWFKPKAKHLLLAKIANSEHPELDQRFEVARQVKFTVRRFMDWLIV